MQYKAFVLQEYCKLFKDVNKETVERIVKEVLLDVYIENISCEKFNK